MTATTIAPDRAEISRQNGRKSRGGGPKTPEGKARSRMNAMKHGMTASMQVLPGEDLDAFRRRVADFIAAAQPRNAIELAVTEQAALATWKIARGERSAAARVRTALRTAEAAAGLGNHDEIAALGQWLLAPDLRAKQEAGKSLFPFLTKDRHDPFGRGRGEPRHIVLRLEASAAGCQWLIDRWAKLRVWLDQGADWRTNELIAALQLRGQRPLGKDAIEWQDLVEPILPTENPEAIAEARRRMLSQFAAGLPDDPAGQRAALWRLVDEETERLLRRQAGHQRREAADLAELADRLAVDTSPEGELMRRYQLDNDRKLDRAINNLVKLRRAGVGVAGDPAAEGPPERMDEEPAGSAGRVLGEHRGAGLGLLPVLGEHPTTARSSAPGTPREPEPEPLGTVEPESGPADGPEDEADAEVQPNPIFDFGLGILDSSLPIRNPESPIPNPNVAVAAGEPPPAGIAAPARAAAEPESHPVPQNERPCPPGGTRPHENGWAHGFSSPAPFSEEPGPAVVRGGGAEGNSQDEPGPPAHGDETPRNEADPATDGDPIVRNEPCAPVGGDPIAPNEPTGSRRIADWSVPALVCGLVILLAAGLSAAPAGSVAGPGGRPDRPRGGRSGPAAAKIRDRGLHGLDLHRESTKGRKHEMERTRGPEPGPNPIDCPGLFRAFVLSCFRDLVRDDGDGPRVPSGSPFTPVPELIGRGLHAPPIGPVIRRSGPARRPPEKVPGAAISAARRGVPAGGQETGVEGPAELGVIRAGGASRRGQRRDATAPGPRDPLATSAVWLLCSTDSRAFQPRSQVR